MMALVEEDRNRDRIRDTQLSVGDAGRRPYMSKAPSTITLAELRMYQRDASRRPPRRCQAISFARVDSLTYIRLII
jgi:hypothetical protein